MQEGGGSPTRRSAVRQPHRRWPRGIICGPLSLAHLLAKDPKGDTCRFADAIDNALASLRSPAECEGQQRRSMQSIKCPFAVRNRSGKVGTCVKILPQWHWEAAPSRQTPSNRRNKSIRWDSMTSSTVLLAECQIIAWPNSCKNMIMSSMESRAAVDRTPIGLGPWRRSRWRAFRAALQQARPTENSALDSPHSPGHDLSHGHHVSSAQLVRTSFDM
jgi:hypothetical protein